jgi:hypothetical protein
VVDIIATVLLAVLMLIPAVNVLVGVVAGGATFGVSGSLIGGSLGALITLAEVQFHSLRLPSVPALAEIVEFPSGRHIRQIMRESALQSVVAKAVSASARLFG